MPISAKSTEFCGSTAHQTNRNDFISSNKSCKVNILPKLKREDFVLVTNKSSESRVAKILDFIGDKVHIIYYFRPDELPTSVKLVNNIGLPIKFYDCELIEDWRAENIQLNFIICKTSVFYAHENDSIASVIEMNSHRHKCPDKWFVVRFRLVKEVVYKLEPIKWSNETHTETETDSEYTSGHETDSNQMTEGEIDRQIARLNLSSRKSHASKTDEIEKLVSPIKIVNKSVHRVKRQSARSSSKERDDSTAEAAKEQVSPSKRAKILNETNANYLTESPVSEKKHYSNGADDRMRKIRKNLNSSFHDTSFMCDDSDDNNAHNYSIVQTADSPKAMRMRLRKSSTAPLKERHDNTPDTFYNQIVNKPIQGIQMQDTPSTRRKSILKTSGGSAKATPKRNVKICSDAFTNSSANGETTPPKTNTRRSTRLSSLNARTMIKMNLDESSPEIERHLQTPKSKRSETKTIEANHLATPRSVGRRSNAPKTPNTAMTPQRTRQLFRSGNLTPSIQSRESAIGSRASEMDTIRERLHVSAVPDSMPCRENEYSNIYSFVRGKLIDGCGGCIYISGVPGTGKTATVTQVIRELENESKKSKLPKFDYVEINGLRLTEPRQAYVQIYRQLTGKTLAWAQARDLLEERFTATKPKKRKSRECQTTVLLLDELDIICNRKQDVVYNLFDWTAKRDSRLVAITIANTMDLPERVLKLKVASRLGLTRLTFQPYTFKQLQEVVMARLAGSKCFISDAVQLVARKVASVSGDCRRALDICRRATEIAEEQCENDKPIVKFVHVNQALTEMFASPKVRAIKSCTAFEKLFLQAVASEITRTGIEEVNFEGVYAQLQTLAPVLGVKSPPNQNQALQISFTLGASRLLIVEDSSTDINQKIILNVSVDDLYYALNG